MTTKKVTTETVVVTVTWPNGNILRFNGPRDQAQNWVDGLGGYSSVVFSSNGSTTATVSPTKSTATGNIVVNKLDPITNVTTTVNLGSTTVEDW